MRWSTESRWGKMKGAVSGNGHAAPQRSELSVTIRAHSLSGMLEEGFSFDQPG